MPPKRKKQQTVELKIDFGSGSGAPMQAQRPQQSMQMQPAKQQSEPQTRQVYIKKDAQANLFEPSPQDLIEESK